MAELEVKRLVDQNRELIVQRLPRYLNPEQFFQLCYALDRTFRLDRNGKLRAAAQRNPDGLLNAILKAADCGLLIGSGHDHCTIIAYGDDIQLSINYHGIIYQLKRAGAVLMMTAACAYDGDHIKVELGDEQSIIHEPNLRDERRRDVKWVKDKANIIGAYAVAWLPDPLRRLKQHHWCSPGDIESARHHSKVPDGPAWTHEYPAMAMKTAVWRVSKFIEICGPTEENREAWERYGRTIEVEKSENRDFEDEETPDDPPGEPAQAPAPTRATSGRRAETGGGSSAKATPPSQHNREAKKAAAPPPPPTEEPPAPASDEPISSEMQDKLFDLMKLSGMKPHAFFKHVREQYGAASLDTLKQSQAVELEKYLKTSAS